MSTQGKLPVSAQGTLVLEHLNTQGTLARERVSTQDTLAREHVFSTGGTQFSRLEFGRASCVPPSDPARIKTGRQLSSYYRAHGISLSPRKLKDNCTFRFFIHSRYLKIVVSLGPEKIRDRVVADSNCFAKSFLI